MNSKIRYNVQLSKLTAQPRLKTPHQQRGNPVITDQEEHLGWTHKLWVCCREETAQRKRHGDKDDPILAFIDVERAVTFCFNKGFRFHDEGMYQLRRTNTYEGWTHELWQCCRFEETAPWTRPTDNGNAILACMNVEKDVTFHFRDKVRVHNRRIYQFLRLKLG